jgi:hypothetical protein
MKLTVKVPDEIADLAKKRGVNPETLVEEILSERLNSRDIPGRPRSSSEIRAWLDSLAQFSEKIPPLPDTISREWIYQDNE